METLNYMGFGVTLMGFALYASTLWAMVCGKRKFMIAFFGSGSLLMSTGLVLSTFLPTGFKDIAGLWFLSALAWIIFGGIMLSMKGFCMDALTRGEVESELDGGKSLSKCDGIEGFWCIWDRSDNRKPHFYYRLVQVYEVSSMLNTIRGVQHYKVRTLCKGLETEEEAKSYLKRFNGTARKVG